MSGDRLFLLKPGFADAAHPGRFFICPHCNAIEGLLASFPGLATQIEVHRLSFEKPRNEIVDVLGEQHQSLPVLVFDQRQPVPEDASIANGWRFIDSSERILRYLADRYAFPTSTNKHPANWWRMRGADGEVPRVEGSLKRCRL